MLPKAKIFRFLLALVILFPFLFGTSPRPAPYHQYRVYGHIKRQSDGPKENYVVSLIGKYSLFAPDSIVDITSYSTDDKEKSVTDTSGYFFLDVQTFNGKADSISIKVSAADKQPFISPTWLIPANGTEILGEQRTSEEAGCNGCGTTEVVSQPYVKGYLYTFEEQTVVLPD